MHHIRIIVIGYIHQNLLTLSPHEPETYIIQSDLHNWLDWIELRPGETQLLVKHWHYPAVLKISRCKHCGQILSVERLA